MPQLVKLGAILTAAIALFCGAAYAASEQLVEIQTRPGTSVRALLQVPANPVGSVILIAGGPGRLDIDPSGRIGALANNQLIRSRAMYASAGLATLTPDIAADLKQGNGVVNGYRWSNEHAADLRALVLHMRRIRSPVFVVGTSRGALSAANIAIRSEGTAKPDAIVITSGLLMDKGQNHPSVERMFGRLDRITTPVLLVAHESDACAMSPASDAQPFGTLLTASPKVDIVTVRGGQSGRGDACGAMSPHGFLGQDADVVAIIADWLQKVRR